MDELNTLVKTQALPAIVSFLVGPLMTLIAKQIAAKAGSVMSPRAKLAISSLAGALAALGVGDVNGLAEAISTLLTGVIGGLGGAKGRDIYRGKTEVIVPKTTDLGNA